mgnify:CR=1 FL=1
MLNSNQIQQIIPHRYPMLLVDKITEYEVGKRAAGIKSVTANEPFFVGHFPDYHAQVGAVALLSEEDNKGKIAFFGGIKKAKFRRQVVPGDQLELECEMTRRLSPAGVGKAVAKVDGQVVCEAELTFVITDASKDDTAE